MITLDKILVLGIACLFIAGCGVMVYDSFAGDEEDLNLEEELIVKNPKTGEVWNSVEEYEFRELNLDDIINDGN